LASWRSRRRFPNLRHRSPDTSAPDQPGTPPSSSTSSATDQPLTSPLPLSDLLWSAPYLRCGR
jgi:hypothetical protein